MFQLLLFDFCFITLWLLMSAFGCVIFHGILLCWAVCGRSLGFVLRRVYTLNGLAFGGELNFGGLVVIAAFLCRGGVSGLLVWNLG